MQFGRDSMVSSDQWFVQGINFKDKKSQHNLAAAPAFTSAATKTFCLLPASSQSPIGVYPCMKLLHLGFN